MAIESISNELCTGCGACIDRCTVDAIRMDNSIKKAVIKYPEDCTCCARCMLSCPVKAIIVTAKKHICVMTAW